jgi:hypothetical protein
VRHLYKSFGVKGLIVYFEHSEIAHLGKEIVGELRHLIHAGNGDGCSVKYYA